MPGTSSRPEGDGSPPEQPLRAEARRLRTRLALRECVRQVALAAGLTAGEAREWGEMAFREPEAFVTPGRLPGFLQAFNRKDDT